MTWWGQSEQVCRHVAHQLRRRSASDVRFVVRILGARVQLLPSPQPHNHSHPPASERASKQASKQAEHLSRSFICTPPLSISLPPLQNFCPKPAFLTTQILTLPLTTRYALRNAQPLNSTLLINNLPSKGIRRAPAQLDRAAAPALDALHADRLRDARLLLRGQAAAGLGVELERVALESHSCQFHLQPSPGEEGVFTFVTASWNVRSSMGWAVALEMREAMASSEAFGRVTAKVVLIALLVTIRSCGWSGRAELKVHSSSFAAGAAGGAALPPRRSRPLEDVGAGAGAAGVGWDWNWKGLPVREPERAAKGSAFFCGGGWCCCWLNEGVWGGEVGPDMEPKRSVLADCAGGGWENMEGIAGCGVARCD